MAKKGAKIRTRVSYKFFYGLLTFLNSSPTKKEILLKFHSVIDDYSGFKSQTNSDYAKESLELLMKDYKSLEILMKDDKNHMLLRV